MQVLQGEVISFIRSAEIARKKLSGLQACRTFSRFDKETEKSKQTAGNTIIFPLIFKAFFFFFRNMSRTW